MTLEYLELMEDVKKEKSTQKEPSPLCTLLMKYFFIFFSYFLAVSVFFCIFA